MPSIKQLVQRAKCLYPHSKYMRKQWVRHTLNLNQTGRAALNNGGWAAGTRIQLLTNALRA